METQCNQNKLKNKINMLLNNKWAVSSLEKIKKKNKYLETNLEMEE